MLPGTPSDPPGLATLENFSKAPAINRWLYERISGFVQGHILEIGCGIGNISAFLLRDHAAVSLSDLRPEYCHLVEKKFAGHPNLKGVYELDLSLKDFSVEYADLLEKFETVIALNVIEHIEDDSLAIRNAKSLLQDQGKLVVLVPAGEWLYNSLDRELGHFKRYSRAGVKRLMGKNGMALTHCRYFNAAAIPGWWFSGNILKEKIISTAKLNLYNHLVPLFRMADWFISPFTGVSVICVAVNNLN